MQLALSLLLAAVRAVDLRVVVEAAAVAAAVVEDLGRADLAARRAAVAGRAAHRVAVTNIR